MIASIAIEVESLTKLQCEIGCANNILLKFQRDLILVGNKDATNLFSYAVKIAESVRKETFQKAATKVDIVTTVLI